MDKIYSRKRIRIPEIKQQNSNVKKIITFTLIILISVFTFTSILKSINPIFEELCLEKVRTLGTQIVNEESKKVLDNTTYNNIVTIEYNENNNTKVLKTDVVIINKISSTIALATEKRFQDPQGGLLR